jgi:hypothetical protein
MEGLLYSFFIESNPNSLLSYQRINRFLSNIHLQEVVKENKFNSLYHLLNIGVIDYACDNKYYMSPSTIIYADNYKVGINLPQNILKLNNEKIIIQSTGLTLFNNQDVLLDDWDIITLDYKFDNFISNFTTIFKIPSNWYKIEFPTSPTKIEKLNTNSSTWEPIEKPIISNSLYKIYSFSNGFFEYYFYYNQNWYKIMLHEFDKVKLAKTIIGIKDNLELKYSNNILCIPRTFPLPLFVEKLLFLNHCLITGGLPTNREYFIEKKEFRKLNKIVFNNYIKTITYE